MSLFNKIASMINTGRIMFLNLVSLANRDYPYHDHVKYDDGDEPVLWVVGSTNLAPNGTQHKLFTSKSLLVYSDVACTIRFNSANNVLQNIVADTFYEFKHNINSVIVVTIATGGVLHLTAEGVLPQEQRGPE